MTEEELYTLEVGSRVIFNAAMEGYGESPVIEGVVVEIEDNDRSSWFIVKVAFEEKRGYFHTCGGLTPSQQGYNLFKHNCKSFELVKINLKTQIQTLWKEALVS